MKILPCFALGLVIGSLSGTLGIGGGVLLLPALVWLFGLKQPEAAGVTLAVLAVPVTLPGVLQYYRLDVIRSEHLQMAAWIAVAFAVGAYVGAGSHRYLPAAALRVGFGLLMVYVGVRLIVSASSEAANAAAGLTTAALALLAYLGLRALGRKHLSPPRLSDQIRAAQQQGRGDIEYHI